MSDVVYCNETQAKMILQRYFGKTPKITNISKNDGIYFITMKTNPGSFKATCQYRCANTNYANACFISVYKNSRRYDLNDTYPKELLVLLNETCKEAVYEYEKDCDLFDEETAGICCEVNFASNNKPTGDKSKMIPISIISISAVCAAILFLCFCLACLV